MKSNFEKINLIDIILIMCWIILLITMSSLDKVTVIIISSGLVIYFFQKEFILIPIKKYIYGEQYIIKDDIKKIRINNKNNIESILNEIEDYYKESFYEVDVYISRKRQLEVNHNFTDNVAYGVVGGLLVFAGDKIINYKTFNNSLSKVMFFSVSVSVIFFIFYYLFFRPNYKNVEGRFLEDKENELLEKKIEEILKKNKKEWYKNYNKNNIEWINTFKI